MVKQHHGVFSGSSHGQQIADLDARVSKFIPKRLRYASSHWLFHLAEADDNWRSALKRDLRHVVQAPYVLYWIEVLSLTGGVLQAIAGFRAATRHSRVSHSVQILHFITLYTV